MHLKVCSFNIKFEAPEDFPHLWTKRLPLIASILENFAPDFFGSQEGRQPQIMQLESAIASMHGLYQHRQWLENRMYPTLFAAPQWDCRGSGDIWLSETPDIIGSSSFSSAFPRLCTWARLSLPKGKRQILLCNLHLDHILESTRLQQIRVLCRELKKIWSSNTPLIILGDFNEGPDGQVRKELLEHVPILHDPWEKMGRPELGSHHKFDGQNHTTKRIDWILCSNHFNILDVQMPNIIVDDIWPSDHFPVMATLKLN